MQQTEESRRPLVTNLVGKHRGTQHGRRKNRFTSDERKHESRKRIEERVLDNMISSPAGRGRQEGGRRPPNLSGPLRAEERSSRGLGRLAGGNIIEKTFGEWRVISLKKINLKNLRE
jgi:hypothetical protein